MSGPVSAVWLLIVFGSFSGIQAEDFLVCYNCKNVPHPENCTNAFICAQGQRCHTIQIIDGSKTYYNLGCESQQTCEHLPSVTNVFGKRDDKNELQSQRSKTLQCAGCCDNTLCNRNMCNSTQPTTTTTTTVAWSSATLITTTDPCHDKPECPYLLKHFPVCNDNDTATNLCPKSCGHCPTTPMTTKACVDQNQMCGYLQDHLNVCADPHVASTLGCDKTCNICGGLQFHTTISTMGTHVSSSSTASSLTTSSLPPVTYNCSRGVSFHVMFLSNNFLMSNGTKLLTASPQQVQLNIAEPYFHSNIRRNVSKYSEIDITGGIQQRPQQIENKGIHVQSSSEISLYVLNTEEYSTDGFLALADDCLGRDYIVSTYLDPTVRDIVVYASILALENTAVSFSLRMHTPSAFVEFNNHRYKNGDTIRVNLAENDTIELKAEYDISGTQIHSSKNVAFTAGSDCAVIGKGTCSHIESMYPPTQSLSYKYFIPTLKDRGASIVRLVSTSTYKTIVNVTYAGHNESKEITPQGYIDLHINAGNPVYLSCSEKVLVTQYATGNSDYSGDPFSMFIPGKAQYLSEYHFATPSTGFSNHITVIINRLYINDLILDGQKLSTTLRSGSNIQVDGVVYTVSRLSINSGYHHIKHTLGQPFGLFVYGNGPSDGYGYPAGFSIMH